VLIFAPVYIDVEPYLRTYFSPIVWCCIFKAYWSSEMQEY